MYIVITAPYHLLARAGQNRKIAGSGPCGGHVWPGKRYVSTAPSSKMCYSIAYRRSTCGDKEPEHKEPAGATSPATSTKVTDRHDEEPEHKEPAGATSPAKSAPEITSTTVWIGIRDEGEI